MSRLYNILDELVNRSNIIEGGGSGVCLRTSRHLCRYIGDILKDFQKCTESSGFFVFAIYLWGDREHGSHGNIRLKNGVHYSDIQWRPIATCSRCYLGGDRLITYIPERGCVA